MADTKLQPPRKEKRGIPEQHMGKPEVPRGDDEDELMPNDSGDKAIETVKALHIELCARKEKLKAQERSSYTWSVWEWGCGLGRVRLALVCNGGESDDPCEQNRPDQGMHHTARSPSVGENEVRTCEILGPDLSHDGQARPRCPGAAAVGRFPALSRRLGRPCLSRLRRRPRCGCHQHRWLRARHCARLLTAAPRETEGVHTGARRPRRERSSCFADEPRTRTGTCGDAPRARARAACGGNAACGCAGDETDAAR